MSQSDERPNMALFWGCFIALITTAFGFISRMFLINTWAAEFGLDPAQAGRLAGIGIWPFAVSIIAFSLFIDNIGYKKAMLMAFIGHAVWAVMGIAAFFVADKATGFKLLYWGSLILGLANGTVEAFINPVVATMFSKDKTKWLNILHAGWPGGLVLAGLITIWLGHAPWWVKVGIIAIPAVVYLIMLIGQHFPENERVAAGVSYKDMLKEFGILGMAVVAFLVTLQLMDFFSDGGATQLAAGTKGLFIGIGVAILVLFGLYTKTLGRGLLFFLILIMIPLATTEIGTDGWITSIIEGYAKENNFHPGWVLVYTSAIMVVLRFLAGPIVHALTPLGVLLISALLAAVGLFWLGSATGGMLFVAATLYGFGKTFFWPTTLGIVAEQTPKGGALTLNAISGIGMLAVGVLGFPYIGVLQTKTNQAALLADSGAQAALPGLVADNKLQVLKDKVIYEILEYKTIDSDKVDSLAMNFVNQALAAAGAPKMDDKVDPNDAKSKTWSATLSGLLADIDKADKEEDAAKKSEAQTKAAAALKEFVAKLAGGDAAKQTALEAAITASNPQRQAGLKKASDIGAQSSQAALKYMAIFPLIMLVCYLVLILYFKSKGGYKPVNLNASH